MIKRILFGFVLTAGFIGFCSAAKRVVCDLDLIISTYESKVNEFVENSSKTITLEDVEKVRAHESAFCVSRSSAEDQLDWYQNYTRHRKLEACSTLKAELEELRNNLCEIDEQRSYVIQALIDRLDNKK